MAALAEALQSKDPEVRTDILLLFSTINPESKMAISIFTEALKASDPLIRAVAITKLSTTGIKKNSGDIVKLLKDKNPQVRMMACIALSKLKIKDKNVVDHL
ncbi:MAG: HEAT repeat domain-containing protein, partial [Candidatus Auribacterota bacterium]|nr:HEAT repeat domain-containing protein [Candidatus Auribacterota bacterium]